MTVDSDIPTYVGSSVVWLYDKGEVNSKSDARLSIVSDSCSPGSNEVLRVCDERFLIELQFKLERGYEDIFELVYRDPQSDRPHLQPYYQKVNDMEDLKLIEVDITITVTETASLFFDIAREVRRLKRYPQLFPSRFSMERFQSGILAKLRDRHKYTLKPAEMMRDNTSWAVLHEAEGLIELWLLNPTFQYDLKPWQQFLNDGSPGSEVNPKDLFQQKRSADFSGEEVGIDERSQFRIIPPGGLAVWANWNRQFKDTEERINQVCISFRNQLFHRANLTIPSSQAILNRHV